VAAPPLESAFASGATLVSNNVVDLEPDTSDRYGLVGIHDRGASIASPKTSMRTALGWRSNGGGDDCLPRVLSENSEQVRESSQDAMASIAIWKSVAYAMYTVLLEFIYPIWPSAR